MTISAFAVVHDGKVTIPVGNNIHDGIKVRVTVVDGENTCPEVANDVEIELDEIVKVPRMPICIEKPLVHHVKGKPSLVGIEE